MIGAASFALGGRQLAGIRTTATEQVDNIAAAKALTGMSVGETINVLGYYTSGDGGGGLFQVTTSGNDTDGGTVFAFDEDLSALQTDKRARTQTPYNLGHTDIVFGTVTLNLLEADDTEVISIGGEHLHGHKFAPKAIHTRTLHYGDGDIAHPQVLWNTTGTYNGDAGNVDITQYEVTYKHLQGNAKRFERVGVTDTLFFDWFGTKTDDVDATFDNQPIVNQAMNVAMSNGSITKLKFAKAKVYEYYGTTIVTDGVTVSGQDGTFLDSDTDNLANDYSPVREVAVPTRYRVKADKGLYHMKTTYWEVGDANYLAPDAKWFLQTTNATWRVAYQADSVYLEDFLMDGNLAENVDAFNNYAETDGTGYGSFADMENEMRNSPNYTGFTTSEQTQHYGKIGLDVRLTNMGIFGYGGTCVLGHINNLWTCLNVRVGDSVWNHCFYANAGNWTNLTFFGEAWTHCILDSGTYNNVVFEADCDGSSYHGGATGFIDFRGVDISSWDETPKDRHELTVLGVRNGEWCPLQYITINGFYADTRNASLITVLAGGIGPNNTLSNGIWLPKSSGESRLFHEASNGFQTGVYPDFVMSGIDIYLTGSSELFLLHNGWFKSATFSDIHVYDDTSNPGTGIWLFRGRAGWRDTGLDPDPWAEAQVWTITNVIYEAPHDAIIKTNCRDDSPLLTINLTNCTFNNDTNTPITNNANGNTTAGLTSPADVGDLTFNFDTCTFNEPAPGVSTLYDDIAIVT